MARITPARPPANERPSNQEQTLQETRIADPWWKTAVIYNIYPRSFQDSKGDGIGDLRGILRRLDHLRDLGVGAVWLSPVYPSPLADGGYDVADYGDIGETFGTMADFDAMLAAMHARGIKLIMDFVPNHTSNQHPWFVASRSSRTHPMRDWYIWKDAAPGGGPPNNWISNFGGSAWQWDDGSGQYYLHSFLKEQPDLNWRNREVRTAMYEILRFWLGRGVDGFRTDVMWLILKDRLFRDDPPDPDWKPGDNEYDKLIHVHDADQDETIAIVQEIRHVLDGYRDKLLIGEIYLPVDRLVRYYGPHLDGAQVPFNHQLIDADWDADNVARIVRDYSAALPKGAWPNWVIGNLDNTRIGQRIGRDQARVAAMLQFTLRGTPVMYYGEELGMTDGHIPPHAVRDRAEKRQPGIGMGRDPERTPMPWDSSANGGFTTGTPWLPLNANHASRNVASETSNPASMLNLYKALIALRRKTPALLSGTLEDIVAEDGILHYTRRHDAATFRVALNFGDAQQAIDMDDGIMTLSTDPARALGPIEDQVTLRANEGIVVEWPSEVPVR